MADALQVLVPMSLADQVSIGRAAAVLTSEELKALRAGRKIVVSHTRAPAICPDCEADVAFQKQGVILDAAIQHDDWCATHNRRIGCGLN